MAIFKRTYVPRPVSRIRHRIGVAFLVVSTLPYCAALVYLLFFSHKETTITFLAWAMEQGKQPSLPVCFCLAGSSGSA